ncbi:MAG: hypothetical protein K6T83_18500 [Alicyclobacillus sp.]|nr:hypothetical protein [Alicyclobacillus sp.]
MEILLAKRPFRPLSNSSRLDQVELLAYAWNICLWVQEAAAQTMYHYPNVALICRVNPFTQIQVKVSLSALIDKSKTIF